MAVDKTGIWILGSVITLANAAFAGDSNDSVDAIEYQRQKVNALAEQLSGRIEQCNRERQNAQLPVLDPEVLTKLEIDKQSAADALAYLSNRNFEIRFNNLAADAQHYFQTVIGNAHFNLVKTLSSNRLFEH